MEDSEQANRRCADRFAPSIGYSRVIVQPMGDAVVQGSTSPNAKQVMEVKPVPGEGGVVFPEDSVGGLEGHAYDISLSGLRFELDNALAEGDQVGIELHLPGMHESIKSQARIVRVYDEDGDPGPRRMAASFKSFESPSDAARLSRHLGMGYFGRER